MYNRIVPCVWYCVWMKIAVLWALHFYRNHHPVNLLLLMVFTVAFAFAIGLSWSFSKGKPPNILLLIVLIRSNFHIGWVNLIQIQESKEALNLFILRYAFVDFLLEFWYVCLGTVLASSSICSTLLSNYCVSSFEVLGFSAVLLCPWCFSPLGQLLF